MDFEAILFDMDGVIIETQDAIARLWQQIADGYHFQLTEQDFYQRIYGCSPKHTIQTVFHTLSAEEQDHIYNTVQDHEPHLQFTAKAGAISWLHTLKDQGILMGLVTSGSKRRVQIVCESLNIADCFSIQITGDMIKHGKPDPACYLLAAEYLQKPPQHCIVFEDALSGVTSAVAAGTCCVGIQTADHAARLIEAGAYTVIPDFTAASLEMHRQNDGKSILSLYSPMQQNKILTMSQT